MPNVHANSRLPMEYQYPEDTPNGLKGIDDLTQYFPENI
jgi:hypothetical protein